MTSKERMLKVLRGELPDRVPVTPDMSNMIPARLTGKDFREIYLYQNPPLWVAYIEAVKKLGFDGFLDYQVPWNIPKDDGFREVIIEETDERTVTRKIKEENGKVTWDTTCAVYASGDPATWNKYPKDLRLPEVPTWYKEIENVKKWPTGDEAFYLAHEMMGDSGLVGVCVGASSFFGSVEDVYAYYDDPDSFKSKTQNMIDESMALLDRIEKMEIKPDYISCGGSGTLVFQTVDMYRELSLPVTKAITKRCKEMGIASHIHSCGPEAALVEICANETDLTFIDPLEIPPMGNCNLKELKEKFGNKIILKGNLHTTEVMLKGSYNDVYEASKQAILDAKAGGGFILSTGDQCGRDTPLENIQAMIDASNDFGKY